MEGRTRTSICGQQIHRSTARRWQLCLRLLLWTYLVLLALVTLGIRPAQAAPGDLDSTFGTGGRVTTDFYGNIDIAHALVLQPDGKLVTAGGWWGYESGGGFALARYNPDGSLDSAFGIGGKVTTDFGSIEVAFALVLQPDGKLVAAGGGY